MNRLILLCSLIVLIPASGWAALRFPPFVPTPKLEGARLPVLEDSEGSREAQRYGDIIQAVLGSQNPTNIHKYRIDSAKAAINSGEVHSELSHAIAARFAKVPSGARAIYAGDREQLLLEAQISKQLVADRLFNNPNFIVRCAIDKFDRISTKVRNAYLGAYFTALAKAVEPYAEIEFESELIEIHLTFTLEDATQGCLIPEVNSEVSAFIIRAKRQQRIGVLVAGNTLGLGGQTTFANGVHDAVLRLCDHGVLVLQGRHQGLPWWKAVQGATRDEITIRRMKTVFLEKMDEVARTRRLQRLLQLNSFKIDVSGTMDESTRQALLKFCVEHDIPEPGPSYVNALADLYDGIPFPWEPLHFLPPPEKKPGVTVDFTSCPPYFTFMAMDVLKTAAGQAKITPCPGKPLLLYVDYPGEPAELAAAIPGWWHRRTGRACRVETRTDRRLKIESLSGF